jgi:hypothetical protein
MKTQLLMSLLVFFGLLTDAYSQTETNVEALRSIAAKQKQVFEQQRKEVLKYAATRNLPVRFERDGVIFEMQYIDEYGKPQYLITNNDVAAQSISTDEVYTGGAAGLNLDGTGVIARQWDGVTVLTTHQELTGRVTNLDAKALSYHSTHVAGTIMASGVVPAAKGMAFAAGLRAFDWDYRESEMADESANGALVSNHSYSFYRGWQGGTWYGEPSISVLEDTCLAFTITMPAYGMKWLITVLII